MYIFIYMYICIYVYIYLYNMYIYIYMMGDSQHVAARAADRLQLAAHPLGPLCELVRVQASQG